MTGKANSSINLHGVNPQALLITKRAKNGRVLLRPQQ
jgi:hypothetical protein